MVPFYEWGPTVSRLKPLQGDSLLFITRSTGIPGTHLINLGKMEGWIKLCATQWFWTRHLWIGNPAPYTTRPLLQEFITSQKLGSWGFWQIVNSVVNKSKSIIPSLFNSPEVLYSASDEAKLFAKNFSKNSNLDDLGISLPVCPSRANLKLHNIYITPKMVKKVIKNLWAWTFLYTSWTLQKVY